VIFPHLALAVLLAVAPGDRAITRAVERQLAAEDPARAARMDVTTEQGVVTLRGVTDTPMASGRAVDAAAGIRGVRAVVDKVDVAPTPRADAAIERDVEAALREHPATEAAAIGVRVEGGVVTLSGTVETAAERKMANALAWAVRGARQVVDQLTVTAEAARPDDEIRADVRGRLDASARLRAGGVRVEVIGGRVRLSGVVGSAAESNAAADLADVPGVRAVDVTGLTVDPGATPASAPVLSDARAREAIRREMTLDPRVPAEGVEVDVEEGEVTLSGAVDLLEAKRAAVENARAINGVRAVVDRLVVRSAPPVPEPVVQRRLEAAIRRDPYVDGGGVVGHVDGGVARLDGRVDSIAARRRAEAVAAAVPGVDAIDDRLQGPRLALGDAVRQRLAWSALVDADRVRVDVKGGTVTLRGDVPTWAARHAAETLAHDAGATRVDNRLEVRR
jgi:osmotically-inducible protein OsmY